jgi:hypothetical protein
MLRRRSTMISESIKTKDALEEFYQDKRTENTAESTLKTYDMHNGCYILQKCSGFYLLVVRKG